MTRLFIYRVTHLLVQNLPLTPKSGSVLAWPALAWPGQSGTLLLKSTGGFAQRDGSPCTSMSKSRCIFILLFCTFARATPEEFQYSPAAMKLLSKMDEQTNATVGRGRVYIDIRLACLLASNEIVLQNECTVQGPAKEWFPGCVNFSGKARQKW